MAILAFQKPDKVVMLEADNQFGRFEFRPLEPGFGVTIGNALRRILLSSLEGYAVNTIRIAGVEHEFSSVPGVKKNAAQGVTDGDTESWLQRTKFELAELVIGIQHYNFVRFLKC